LAPTSKANTDAARKRVAVEIIAQHGRALRQTARRYSLCAADAEDAYQRALEILLTKAPTADARELIRWTQTVTKHEALAVRRNRERLLSGSPPSSSEDSDEDWMALIPAPGDGPAEKVERREAIARSREALQALKPAELRALTLLAEGYSYAEISELTGFTRTKVNRSLAEGRERFRALLSSSQDGSRCKELRPLLSAFCDGEAGAKDTALMREHLRACAPCRAAMRAYRAAPGAASALAPIPPVALSLLDRFRDAIANLSGGGGSASSASGTGGGGASSVAGSTASSSVAGSSTASSSVAGASAASSSVAGSSGVAGVASSASTGVAALTKAVAVCATAVGGAAACVAVGVAPAPLDLADSSAPASIQRGAEWPAATLDKEKLASNEAPSDRRSAKKERETSDKRKRRRDESASAAEASTLEAAPAPESAPPPEPAPESESVVAPEPAPVPVSETPSASAGAAGEFGP
jgi:RNA polymerase sigma factor (sigma-70 family)